MDLIRGVNLGNWLVLEKWMSPSMFANTDCEDETWLCRTLDEAIKRERYLQHRSTYITERDFAYIAGAGLNAVRIPVPYFIFDDVEPFVGCIEYLDKAFDWAEAFDIKILIDLHTAPGSQNGFDNGGICGVCKWAQSPKDVEFVLTVLERLSARYANRSGLYGVQVLNEPISEGVWVGADIPSRYPARDKAEALGSGPIDTQFLKTFYRHAYSRIRAHLPVDKVVAFHDGFRLTEWDGYFNDGTFENVVLDTHPYLMTADGMGIEPTLESYTAYVQRDWVPPVQKMQGQVPLIVGEWCVSNKGASQMSDKCERRSMYRALYKLQADLFEQGAGWFYWSYKLLVDATHNESQVGTASWDYARCVSEGWVERLK